MALKKIKSCEVCQELFRGRANAKTCSAKCRKRLQRSKEVLELLESEADRAEKIAVNVVRKVGNDIRPDYVTQEGFIGSAAPGAASTSPRPNPQPRGTPLSYADNTASQAPMNNPIQQIAPAELEPVEKPPVTVVHNHYAPLEKPFRRHVFEATLILLIVVLAGATFSFFNTRSNQANLKAQSETIKQLASSLNTSNFVQNPTKQSNLNFNVDTVISDGKKLTATGQVAVQNEADSTHAFTVQNSSGKSVLTTDTTNGRVGIGQDPTGSAALQVGGDITASGSIVSTGGKISLDSAGLHINNVLVCTTNGCISSTKTPASPPQTMDVADVAFLSQNQTLTGNNTFKGSATFAGAFQVQNSSGTSLLVTDGANSKVGIGITPLGGGATLQVAGNVSANGYQIGSTTGASLACGTSELIQHPTVSGGIITGGICVPPGGIPPTFDDIYANSSPPTLTLNSTNGTLIVQDALAPIGMDLFTVQSNGGGTKYFSVSASGVKVNGYDVCTLAGNCAGVGGDVTTAGGTTGKIAKFTASNGIGDSIISDNGSTVTIGGSLAVNTITPSGPMVIGSTTQHLVLQGDATTSLSSTATGITNTVVFATPSGSNKTITVPNTTGTLAVTASGPVQLDAAGNISCPTCLTTGAGGGTTGVTSVNTFTGDISIQGTTNEINISNVGATITLSTPQAIGTTSSPTFANVNVTGQYQVGGSQIASANLSDTANIALLNGNQTASGNKTYTGTSLYKNTSATSFQIQNSDSTMTLLVADTSNGKVGIGAAPSSSGSTLQVTGDINSSSTVNSATGFAVGGTSGSSTTCSGGNVLSNITISGGIIVGGSCAINGGGISPTLQNVYDNSTSPATILTSSSSKGFLLKAGSSADSTALFQIQNSGSANLFTVDSSNSNINLGQLTAGALGAWSTNANLLPAGRNAAASITANGYLYIIGGGDGNGGGVGQTSVYYAKTNSTGSTGAWQTNANSLPAGREYPAYATYNGYVYVMGGSTNGANVQSTVYYARLNSDGSIGSWGTNSNALPTGLSCATGAAYNGYLYVIGGNNGACAGGGTAQSAVYYAKINPDGTTGSWTASANSLPAGRDSATTTVVNGYAYVIGGVATGGSAQNTVYYAKLNSDGSTGVWSTNVSTLPSTVYDAGIATVNNYVYIIGGVTGLGNASTVYYAKLNSDGSTGAWSTNSNSLPAVRGYDMGATYNGYVYSLGGVAGSSQTSVYYSSVMGMTRNSGQESISDQLTVGNGLTVAGNTTFQPTADSTSAFTIQNSTGGSLFNIDSTNSNISIAGLDSGQLGAWQTNTNALPQALSSAASVTANGYVYEIGGSNSGTARNTVYYAKLNADGTVGAWNTNSNTLPGGGKYYLNAVTANGYVYAIGGYTGSSLVSTVYYAKLNADGSTGAWQTNANFLPAARYASGVVIANGYIYDIGGHNESTGNGTTTVYYAKLNADGSTGAWQTNTNALPENRIFNTSVTANGYIYSIAGCIDFSCSGYRSIIYYAQLNSDGSVGTWSTASSLLPQTLRNVASVISNGYLYVMGGNNGTAAQSTIYYAKLNPDGSLGVWQTNTNSLPQTLEAASAVMASGYVYEIGGINTTAQSTVYYASTSRVSIGANIDLIGPQGGDGTAGGSLTANNLTAAGNLQVNGSGSFTQGLGVGGNLSVGGSAAFQSSTGLSSAFSIQSTTGAQAFNVNTTTTPNLIANGDFESNTNGWSGKGSATLSRTDTNTTGFSGVGSLKITTTAAANDGASFNYTFAASTQYTLSLYAKAGSGTVTTINVGRQDVSGTDIDCLTGQSINNVSWTRLICTFTTGSTITPPTQIYIKQSDATARNFNIDAVQLEQAATASTFQANQANLQIQTATNSITLDGANSGALSPWTTNTSSLPGLRQLAMVVQANGYIYDIGGDSGTGQSTVYYAKLNADGSTGTWSTNTNALPAAVESAGSFVANGYVYILGGYSAGATSTVYYAKLNADGSTGTWQTSSNSLPQNLVYGSAATYNGYAYMIGGCSDGTCAGPQSTVYYAKLNADGSTGTWQTNSSALPQALGAASEVVANGYVYILGGKTAASSFLSTVYYAKLNADGSTGSWQTNSINLPASIAHASSAVSNGYVYYIAGCNGTSCTTLTSSVYFAKLNTDGSVGAWTTGTNALPITNRYAGSIVANGYIYEIGGSKTSVYYASTSRVQIGANLDLVGLQGGTLTDAGNGSTGSTGGSITAGNGTFVGILQVQGAVSLAQGANITGNLTTTGTVLFQTSTNSAIALQIQNSSGTSLLTADTSGMNITIGGALSVSGNVAVGGYLITNGGMYATSLPGSPVNGQEIYYEADPTNGVVWHLRYNSTSGYWEFLGGSPLYAEVDTGESTTSSSYTGLTTAGPSLTLPLGGDYDIKIESTINFPNANSGGIAAMSYSLNGGAASDVDAAQFVASNSGGFGGFNGTGTVSAERRITGRSASDTVVSQYKSNGNSATFSDRVMIITPVRVH